MFNDAKLRIFAECVVVKDDLKKCGLDRGLVKDGERRKAQVMEKMSDKCEHGQGTQNAKRECAIQVIKGKLCCKRSIVNLH